MSGDVQPRKRKDKKKKRDDEDIKESHHGVHLTKMGSDDVHLHVQSDHGTGGHWCAKIFFFSLLAILFGLVGLIILENRGLSDLDTPLSESRFSEYFDGWVDEHRGHDDHHETKTGLENHDQDAGPFEEEEDHSEQEEDESHDAGFHDDDEHDEEGAGTTEEDDADEEEEANKAEDDDDNDNENDDTEDIDHADDDNETGGDNDDEDDENTDQDDQQSRDKREVQDEDQDEEANDEGFEDEDNTSLEEEETPKNDETDDDDVEDIANEDKEAKEESTTQRADDDDAPFDESHTNNDSNGIQKSKNSNQNSEPVTKGSSENHTTGGKREGSIEDDTGKSITADGKKITSRSEGSAQKTKEDDDDFENESLEEVVDNDAGELLHLRQKAEQEELAARAAEAQEVEESDSAPLAVKIVVGLALALVARLVLVKKSKPTNADEPARGSPEMKRRFTMISAEDNVPVESEELVDEELDEEEYLEEEEEEDEQLQYSEDEDEEEAAGVTKFMPETFEQLNAMYRPKPVEPVVQELPDRKIPETVLAQVPASIPIVPQVKEETRHIVFDDTPQVNLVEPLNIDEYDVEPDDYDDEVRYEHDADEEVSDEDDADIYSGSEEDIDDEELSDVDDNELMKRLEEKYGKLPAKQYGSEEDDDEEPTWTKIRPNARGPQSYADEDEYIDEEIRRANEDLFNDNLKSALQIYESLVLQYPDHPGALYGKAKVLDRLADKYKSNHVLNEAIESYRALLSLDKKIEDEIFRDAAERCLDRMRFKGMHIQSVPIYRKLIKRFSNEPKIRNQLAVTYLLLNRLPEAKYILHRTLMRWRDDGFAQAHYGFILKIHDNDLKGAVALLREGIASGANGTQDGRFYFNLGDALYRLGERKEAMEVYRKGAELNLFPSEYQRSLYNVPELKAQPFWTKEETTHEKELNILERNWALIRNEAMAALNSKGFFIDEAESLKDTGDWKQLELFARGSKIAKNCVKTPLTCKIIETFPAARSCKRGQVKFSVMHPGTHVWAHCGPTNCRLRAHLGLKVPPGTTLRVATEERTWKEGEFLIFDDSFEHEVWHNGTSLRLVLIVDIWHPELTEQQRDTLSPI